MRQRTKSYQRICTYTTGSEILNALIDEYGKYIDVGRFTARLEMFPRVKSIEEFWWVVGMGLYINDEQIGEVIDVFDAGRNVIIEMDDIQVTVRPDD